MRVGLVASLLALGTAAGLHAQTAPPASDGPPASLRGEPRGRLEQALPFATLSGFVENRGQWAPEVKFFASRGGIDATILQDALIWLDSSSTNFFEQLLWGVQRAARG